MHILLDVHCIHSKVVKVQISHDQVSDDSRGSAEFLCVEVCSVHLFEAACKVSKFTFLLAV